MTPELLAPAGSLECLETALYFGADAVYCGGPMLQLRATGVTFSFEDLEKAAALTHEKGKKLYVTVNCFAKNGEIALLGDYANRLYSIGVDAAIVSDLGVLAEIKDKCPALPVHISTQANTQNYKSIEVYKQLGASRVVLGREMTLEEIEQLPALIPGGIEIEVFIHGAMCMAYSGRCLLSSFLANRSGNRGECAQPCRWNYYLIEEKRQNMCIPVTQEGDATAIFSSTDLKSTGFTDRLIKAGVASFKIEGRMKSPYYVATVVNAYRQLLDGRISVADADRELDAASHRPYASGFYFGEAKNSPNNDGLYHSDCVFCGIVRSVPEKGRAVIEMRNRFSVGDTLEILSPALSGKSFCVTSIVGADGAEKQSAQLVQELVTLPVPFELHTGDMLRMRKKQPD